MDKWLKELDNKINLTKEQQDRILRNLENNKRRKHTKTEFVFRFAVLFFVLVSLPVSTNAVIGLMERFNIEKKDAIKMAEEADCLAKQEVIYSRPYFEQETERMDKLTKSYIMGQDPHEEISTDVTNESLKKDELYFSVEKNQYHLPERLLTDEELLQIIKHRYKNDYIFATRYKEKYGIHDQEENLNMNEEIKISQPDAIYISNELLTTFGYGNDMMEINSNLVISSEPELELEGLELPLYIVNFSIKNSRYYDFYVSAIDGKVKKIELKDDSIMGDISAIFPIETVDDNINTLYQQSLDFISSKLELKDKFKKIICEYYEKDGKLYGGTMDFCFIKEDGSFYKVGIRYNTKKICSFVTCMDYVSYQESKKDVYDSDVIVRTELIGGK